MRFPPAMMPVVGLSLFAQFYVEPVYAQGADVAVNCGTGIAAPNAWEKCPFNMFGSYQRGGASTTLASLTTIMPAPAANKLYITGVQCGRTDAGTTAISVALDDGATTNLVLPNSGGGGGNNQVYTIPLVVAAQTAFTFTPSAPVTSVFCFAQGFNAP